MDVLAYVGGVFVIYLIGFVHGVWKTRDYYEGIDL